MLVCVYVCVLLMELINTNVHHCSLFLQTSSFGECTPSPNKVLTENPLNAFVKQEESGETSLFSIKQEPEALGSDAQVAEENDVKVKLEESCFPPL